MNIGNTKSFSVLHSAYSGCTPYQVLFSLNNPLTWRYCTMFIILSSIISRNAVWNTNFLQDNLFQNFFLLYSTPSGCAPFQLCLNLNSSFIQLKSTIFKWYSQSLRISVGKPFFSRKSKPTFPFASDFKNTEHNPYQVSFNLNNSLTRRIITISKSTLFASFVKFRPK